MDEKIKDIDLTADLPEVDSVVGGQTIKESKPVKAAPKERELADEPPEPRDREEPAPKRPKSVRESIAEARDTVDKKEVVSTTEPKDKESKEAAPAVDTKPKTKPPVGWPKAAKEKWDSLPEEIQAATAKREEEVSKGFKEYGEKANRLQSIEQTITGYVPDYKNFVQQPEQVVERTLQWFAALRNPNRTAAAHQARQLMANFGLDEEMKKLYGQTAQTTTNTTQAQPQPQQQSFNPLLAEMQNKLNLIEQERNQSAVNQATDLINSWSADKPHFEQVRNSMRNIIEKGLVKTDPNNPITKATLDEAYKLAVRMDDEVFQEEVESEKARVAKALKAEADKERKRQEAERSKSISVGLKPTAPIDLKAKQANSPQPKRNRTAGEDIRAAIREVRGT